MNWHERWKALAARIDGAIEAGKFMTSSLAGHVGDPHDAVRTRIMPELREIASELKHFKSTYEADLPPATAVPFERLFKMYNGWPYQGQPNPLADLQGNITALITFRSEFEYLVQDTEVLGRSRTERAFEHLRQQIAADPDIRKKWKQALIKKEPACEKLGAVHLLGHGIWAFKVQGGNAVTDLVYNEPLDESLIKRTATALVLTEWKVAKNNNDAIKKAKEAKIQTEEYTGGVLGGIELKETRYVILVSEKHISAPSDYELKGVQYRHICIPVNPDTPSKVAKKLG